MTPVLPNAECLRPVCGEKDAGRLLWQQRGDERGIVGFGIDIGWRSAVDRDQLQLAGVLIGADERTCAGITFEQSQLREDLAVEQNRIPNPILIPRGDDWRS